ncbi:MAG: glutathione S-transferase family protein, partial [Pseudomonadota bacterium]
RSVFTVWLLEELGLDYGLKIYDRLDTSRAPPELKDAHPLGKSPVVEMEIAGEPYTIAESGVIASLLCAHYDDSNRLSPPASDVHAQIRFMQWLHYPESSGILPLMFQLITNMSGPPRNPGVDGFTQGELDLHLGYLESHLSANDYVCGDSFQAADVGVTFMTHMAAGMELLKDYPALTAYHAKNIARPAFLRAMEKTGG